MSDAYLKVKDNGAQGLALVREETDTSVSELKTQIKSLDDIVLEEYNISSQSTIPYNIPPSTGKWATSNNYSCYYFEVPIGTSIARIKSNATNGTVYALLSSTDAHTVGSTPSYATGCNRTFIQAGLETNISVPQDCKYIWITKTLGGSDYAPQYLAFNISLQDMHEDEWDCAWDAVSKEQQVTLLDGIISNYISPSNNKWASVTGKNSGLYKVPLDAKYATITANQTNNSYIGFLKSNNHTSDDTPDYATGETNLRIVPANHTEEFKIPSDCTYLYIWLSTSTSMDMAPSSAKITYYANVPLVDQTLTKTREAADAKVTGDKISELEHFSDSYLQYSIVETSGKGVNSKTGTIYNTSSSFGITDYVDVSQYKKITYRRIVIQYATAPTHGMAFYDENKNYISGIRSDFGENATAGYNDFTTYVPLDAKYACFTVWGSDTYGDFYVKAESILKSSVQALISSDAKNNTNSYKWLAGLVGIPHKTDGKFNVAARMRMLCDIEWTPIAPVPRERWVSGNITYDSFPAGEKQIGIPYGAQLTYEQWMGKNISFETFLSALANPNSVMYDFSRVGTAYRQAAWYSVNCSKAAAWALNLPNVYASGSFASDPHISIVANAGEYTANDIHIGDLIESIGVHTAFITDLVYNSFGELSQIEVCEAVTPTCRRKRWNVYGSFENFFNVFSGYRLERYDYVDSVPPVNMESMFPYISQSIGLNYGNKSNYTTSDTIELTLLNKVSNTLIVKKNGEQVDTIDVTSYDQSAIVEYTQSTAGWYDIGFDGDASKNYVGFCVNDNAATFDSSTSKLTFSSSESTLFMVSYSRESSRAHISDVFPTSTDLTNGYMTLTVPASADYIHVTFANDYGKTIIEIALD